ncbi:MAG: nucleotidyltransferase family protein [Dehalococcoidia bacterium]|nr:nucleotidyltransferase family protein [Dehalococcoidia bacterium]
MKAVILAAGLGTRLRPLTDCCPKAMLPLNGKPLLQYNLDLLKAHGLRQVAVNLHHLPEVVIRYLLENGEQGLKVNLAVEPRLLGTAGGAKNLESFLDETFLVLYGDVLTTIDLGALVSFHNTTGGMATVAVHEVDDPSSCGVAVLGKGGRISHFVEKPPKGKVASPWANAGVYVMEPDILSYIPPEGEYDFGRDLFPSLLRRGVPVYSYPFSEYLVDIGSPQGYEKAKTDLQEGRYLP